jgi:O-antigen/teichoic acid export membrane protein
MVISINSSKNQQNGESNLKISAGVEMGKSDSRLYSIAEETVGGAFLLFGGGTLATVLSAICSIIIARLLGPELYGIYSLALIVPGFLMLFTDYGVSQALTKYIAENQAHEEENRTIQLIKSGLAFNMATSIIMLLIGLALLQQLTTLLTSRPEIAPLTGISILLIIIQPTSTAICSALLGLGNMRGYALVDVIRQASRAVLSPLLVIIGLSVIGAVAGYVIAFAIGAAVASLLIYGHYRQLHSRQKTNLERHSNVNGLKSMIAYGFPLYMSNTIQSFTLTFRGILLAYFTTNFVIGNFNTAMNFAVLITLLSTPVATALFPAFSRLSDNHEEAKTMFNYSVKYTTALIIPLAIYVATMSRDLIYLLYGARYTHSPLYLSLYALTFLYTGLGSTVLGSFFSGVGDTKVNLKSTLIYTAFFIPAATALTWIMGAEGLLLAIIASTGASVAYSLKVAMKKYSVQLSFKNVARLYAAAFLSAVPIIPLALYSPLHRIINILLGAAIYGTAYLTITPLLKAITYNDLKNLERIFVKMPFIQPLVKIVINYEGKLLKP